jgi:SAM-dependent methyltransferase
MGEDPYWRMWSSLNRAGQEMMWEALSEPAFREQLRLVQEARRWRRQRRKLGSLRVSGAPVPRYIAAVDIHNQPGGYGLVLGEDDVYAGALYDLSAYHYSIGGLGPMGSDPGDSTVAFLKQRYPDFRPRRILDLGASIGASTLPLADGFPAARVDAIDVSEGMMRYADARAKSLGRSVHFSQQNAEHTDFADATFDLVVSHLFFHETSAAAVRNVMRECCRLLKPGGIMIHSDVPESNQFHPDPYDQWWRDWTTHYNAEPFRSTLRDTSLSAVAVAAGFGKDDVFETRIPSAAAVAVYKKTHGYGAEWHLVVGRA